MTTDKMEQVKALLSSKTVWGAIVVLLAQLLRIAGVDISEAEQGQLSEHLATNIGTLAGIVMVVYGRWTAKKVIKPDTGDKAMVMLMVLPALALAALLSGCGAKTTDGRTLADLTPLEQATLYGVEAQKTYSDMYEMYAESYATADAETQKKLAKEVAPVLNDCKEALKAYLKGVRAWHYAQKEPADMASLTESVKTALGAVTGLVLNFH